MITATTTPPNIIATNGRKRKMNISATTPKEEIKNETNVIIVSRFNPYRWTPLIKRIDKELSKLNVNIITIGIEYDNYKIEHKSIKAYPRIMIKGPSRKGVIRIIASHYLITREIIQYVNNNDIDAIIFENVDLMPDMWMIKQIVRRPPNMIYLCSELAVKKRQIPYRIFEAMMIKHIKGMIINNIYRAKYITKKYRKKVNYAVIPNTLYSTEICVEKARACMKYFKKAKTKAKEVIIIYQGIVTKERCIMEICKAMTLLECNNKLIIIGAKKQESSYVNRVMEYIEEAGMSERIRVVPWMDYKTMISLTKSADIGILLYRNVNLNHYYCAPNKLYEYMSSGVPCIAPKYPEMEEIIEGNNIGVVVDPENPDEIAKAIKKISDGNTLKEMSNNAIKLFRTKYAFDIIWEKQRDKVVEWINEK